MPKISALPVTITPTGDDLVAVVQSGVTKKATLATLPIAALTQTALDGKQPLDSDLTAYANAADAAARRALIGAETAGAAATVQSNLDTHTADTAAHGATASNTASRIVARSATGTATLSGVVIDPTATPTQAQGLLSWNANEETVDVGLSATEGISIGAELSPRYRNGTGSTIAAGTAVYITGSTGTYTNVGLAQANALLSSRDCIGIVTTDAGIATNQRGRVCTYGVSHNHNTSGFADGAEVWLSPTVAGGLTATEPTVEGQFKVLVGKVQRSHATLGEIFVDPHYLGSVTGDGVGSAVSQAAARTALGLGTLATQSGTFSGTSSGTNTGDQTITLTGDVTGTGTGSFATTIAANVVTNAKLAQVATQTFKGRNTAGTGDPEDLSVATVKTMLAISNVDNTSDANKPVSTATQTALNLKADIASPTFTGDPKAPTPATTDSDTSIATTAMVQAVSQAVWTQPTAISITAAGNSNVAAVSAQNRYLTQRINVTAFSGTATVTVQSASAIAGDKRRFIVAMPAGMGNLIELRNLTSGGTLLATVPMDGALARTWLGYSTFDGTNWGAVSFSPLSVDEFVSSRSNALLEREGLRFDGTAGAVIGNGGIPAVGTGDFTFAFVYNPLAAPPLTYHRILSVSDGSNQVLVDSSGALFFYDTATVRSLGASLPLLSPSSVVLKRSNGVLSATVNQVAGTLTPSTSASVAVFNYCGVDGLNYTDFARGTLARLSAFNYALTASEIAALTRRGLVTLPEQRGGSMVALNTSAWTLRGGSASPNTGANITFTAAAGQGFYFIHSASKVGGVKYLATWTQPTLIAGLNLLNLWLNSLGNSVQTSYSLPTAEGTYSTVLTQSASGTPVFDFYLGTTASALAFTNISIIPLGTLFEQDSGQRNAGYMVRDTSGNGRHLELPATGVSIIDPSDTGFIEYTRTTDGYLIGDRRVIPSTGYLVEVVATGNGTATLGESAGTPANVCASVTLTSTPKILPILVTQTSTGKLYADLGTATTATFKIRLRAV